jgi:hypothetical protein
MTLFVEHEYRLHEIRYEIDDCYGDRAKSTKVFP